MTTKPHAAPRPGTRALSAEDRARASVLSREIAAGLRELGSIIGGTLGMSPSTMKVSLNLTQFPPSSNRVLWETPKDFFTTQVTDSETGQVGCYDELEGTCTPGPCE
jgi:hypothetical protein